MIVWKLLHKVAGSYEAITQRNTKVTQSCTKVSEDYILCGFCGFLVLFVVLPICLIEAITQSCTKVFQEGYNSLWILWLLSALCGTAIPQSFTKVFTKVHKVELFNYL
jgi:hypothetical protein